MSGASIALNRFGLGARPDDRAPGDPRAWATAQIARYDARPPALAAAPALTTVALAIKRYNADRRAVRASQRTPAATAMADPAVPVAKTASDAAARKDWQTQVRDFHALGIAARFDSALTTPTPFAERLVHFWSNHFAVSADKLPVRALAGNFEFDAIRPHVMGRFVEMLAAVERHPAMLLYLDQTVSTGPHSPAARNAKTPGRGLNENLAREIMELHTLGVRTGYSQADVTEFARAMTGWTVDGVAARPDGDDADAGRFAFLANRHEPGDRTIIGKLYPARGEEQAQAVLGDLARHPATARHIATKLARHFAGDAPPAAMVDRLAAAFQSSGGDLPTVYGALIASPEAWIDRPMRFRAPWDWAVATLRALGTRTIEPGAAIGLMAQLGQPVWRPGQPSGWDDLDATWAGPDAIMRRVEAAERFAARTATPIDARALAATLYPAAVSPATAQALTRAESPSQATALLLVSPEALRR